MKSAKDLFRRLAKFDTVAASGRKRLYRMIVLFMTFGLLVTSSELIPIGYAVSLDGEKIGYVASKEDAQEIIESAENHAERILGEELALAEKVSVTSAIIDQRPDDSGEIEKKVLESIDNIRELYAVYIDGQVVAAVADEKILDVTLDYILDNSDDGATLSVGTVQSVAGRTELVDESLLVSAGNLYEILNPENDTSECALNIKTAKIVTENTEIPFETIETTSDKYYADETVVIEEGKNGILSTSKYVVCVDGAASEETVIAENVIEASVAKQIVHGTKERPSTRTYGNFVWPTHGQISSYFGYRNTTVGSTYHQGIDIWSHSGAEIYAADGGVVTFAGWSDGGYGNLVVIEHDDGRQTWYAHCQSVAVSEGDRVFQGQVIAYMGMTGTATGVHLHFEVHVDGERVDPLIYLP